MRPPSRVGSVTVEPVEQGANRVGVLLGEHLGRHHERTLSTPVDGGQQGRDRDDRLTRADVALEQAVHRVRRAEVREQLGDRTPLRRGRLEGEPGKKPRDEGRVVTEERPASA